MKLSEIQVIYKSSKTKLKISNSRITYDFLLENWNMDTIEYFEEFKILLLNRANFVLGIYTVSKGGIAGTIVDSKVIFGVALKAAASGLIVAHNHPSGNLKPSSNDIEITKSLVAAGKILDVKVLDHIIVANTGYFSFADEGML